MKRMILGVVAAVAVCTAADANEVVPPASTRFADATQEVPDFQTRVSRPQPPYLVISSSSFFASRPAG